MDWPGLAWPAHGNAVKETEIEVLLPLPHTHTHRVWTMEWLSNLIKGVFFSFH